MVFRLTLLLLLVSYGVSSSAAISCVKEFLDLGQFKVHDEFVLIRPIDKRYISIQERPAFLDADLYDPRWTRLFVRDSNQSEPNPKYIKNISDSIKDYFDPWFRRGDNFDFEKMLREMHKGFVFGKFKTKWRPEVSPSEGDLFIFTQWELTDKFIGKFVDEMKELNKDFRFEMRLDAFPGYRTKILTVINGRGSFTIGIDGLKYEINFPFFENGIYHFPSRINLKYYRKRMAELMGQLRRIPVEDKSDRFLDILASYYHTAINSHVFYRHNNSLFMAQVNYILLLHGFRGVSHGHLDLDAFTHSSQEFLEVFKTHISKYQKN